MGTCMNETLCIHWKRQNEIHNFRWYIIGKAKYCTMLLEWLVLLGFPSET